MAINNITGFSANQAQQRTESSQVQVGRSEPSARQQETGRPSTVDTVSLTDTAARLRQMENTLAQLPVVDNQRVEEIRRAIAEGTFEVDPKRVAEKMVGLEKELSR
jgi:negative regulator of flagellin synthesis FlgM